MRKILAIDVGLKNMGVCIASPTLTGQTKIIKWAVQDVFNLSPQKCMCLTKKCKVCGKNALWVSDTVVSCKTHANPLVCVPLQCQKTPTKSMCHNQIAVNTIKAIEAFVADHTDIDVCVIEQQPCINQRMRFVSHVLFTRMIMMGCPDVRFKRATAKLRIFKNMHSDCPTMATPSVLQCRPGYARRKHLSVLCTRWALENVIDEPDDWKVFFESHNKKDDLADSLGYILSETLTPPVRKRLLQSTT